MATPAQSRTKASTPIRVGVVIPRYAPIFGGAENQCRLLNRQLCDQHLAHVAFVVTKRLVPELVSVENIDGTTIHRIGRPGLSRWSEYGFYLRACALLWARRGEFDLIHCHATGIVGFVITVFSQFAKKPVVLKLSSNGELMRGLYGGSFGANLKAKVAAIVRRPLARYVARHAHLIALNSEGLDEARVAGGRHVHLVRNGVDMGYFKPLDQRERSALRTQMSLDESDFVFIYAGRFVASKGIDVLFAAIAALPEVVASRRVIFLLVGSAENQDDSVEVKSHDSRIRVIPTTDDVRRFLQISDGFVFPSRREGMPNAVIEALAVGLPCVLSDIRPHLELADDNPQSRCYFFKSGDPAALSSALGRCVREGDSDRTEVRSTIAPHYSMEDIARAYSQVYSSAVG